MPEFGWTTGEEGKTPLLDLKAGASLELSKDKRFVDYLEQQKIANQLNVPTAVVEAQPALAKSKLEQLEIEKNPALQQIAAQGPEYAALVRENKEEIVSVASYFEQEEQATPKRKKIYEVIAEAWELDEKEKENESTLLRAIKAPERFMSGVFNSIIMPELSLRAADYAIETSEKAMDAFNDAPGFLEGYEAAKKSLLLSRNENLEGMKNSLNFAWDEGKIQNRALEISSALLSGDFESADRVADEYRADLAEIEKNKKSGPNSEGLEWLAAPAITNFARDVENAPLMAGATVAGTLVGSGVGFGLARGKGAAQGAKLGTFAGYMLGQGAVSFQVEMGSFYADTASELDDRGEALPKDSVRAAAFLYASGATAIEMGADTYLAKALGLGKIADKAGLIVARKEFKEKLVDLAKSQKGQELLTNIAVKMAKGMTSEGLEEASQEALSMLISYELKEQLNVNGDNEFANNELFTRENLSQLENAFSTGARAFLGQGSAITLGSTILDARANAAILKFADKEQALSEAINDGAIKKISLDHAEVAIEQLGAKGNIYIQAEDFIELKQSVALAEALGLDFKNIEQAVAKGHLLEIPRAKALVRLDKEQYAAIAPIMRYDTDALNAKEVQEIESNLGQVILEKAQIHEAATKDKELFEQALALHEENVIAAIDANPNLRMQAAAQAGGVEAYVSTYMKMLRGFSERMAYAGASLTSTLEKLIVNTELGKNIKQQDPVAVLQQHIADNSIPALTDADNIQLAFDEVLKSGVLSKEEATKALEVVSNPNLLEEYYLELEREAARAELGKQAKPEWLEYAWGRIDGKALKETWPDAYKEISRSVGVGVFRSAKRGGIAIDQLADEMVSEGLLPYDADSDDLVEMLKGYERQELYQAVEQAGTESNAEIEKAAKLWREKGTESPYFKKWFGNSKVIDENGKPLVVYHGTGANFEAFSSKGVTRESGSREGALGIWFTDNAETAENFSAFASRSRGGKIYPVYLNIKNPLRVKDYGEIMDIVDADTVFSRPGHMAHGRNIRMVFDKADVEKSKNKLVAQGYDGIILEKTLTDSPDGSTHINQYVAFEPEQIKSAFNRGTFDQSDPRILYQALNPGVDLNKNIPVISAKNESMPVWQAMKGRERKAIVDSISGDILNKPTGETINLSRTNAEHLISSTTNRGLGGQAHVAAVRNVRELLTVAELIESYDDVKKQEGVRKVHRFYAPMFYDGSVYTVNMTVKEHEKMKSIVIEGVKKLYDLKLEKKNTLGIADGMTTTSSQNIRPEGVFKITIRTLLEGVNDHQGNSFFQGYRGSMRTMADGQYLVKLFEKANLSTLLHETGHVFMAEMGMAVKNGVADQTMIDDYATLQSWLAQFDDLQAAEKQYNKYVKGSFNNRAFSELTPYEAKQAIEIVKQEYFARGFERYLAEGKAPSHDLQEVFRRFAAWLKAVYRTVAKLDVELNDEVRRVFDRMLNVDEEISQAAFANEVVAMTNEQIEALKLNKEDKAKLNELLERGKQAAINLMTEKRLSGNKERRRLWAEEAWAELLKQPVYKLRDEINKDGQALDGQALQYFIGEEGVKLLRRHLGPRAINMDGNGQVVEAVAVKYGYANISEMVKDLLESKPKGKAIKEIVETKQAEYDAQIKPEDFLLQTPELAERVEAVGKYIETALGIEGRTAVINYQAVAAEHLQSLSVSQASSQLQFIGALRRALKKERKAIVKDDFAEALKANRQARLNIELLKQSMAFKEQTKKDESRLKAFMKTKSADVDAKFVAMVIGAKHAMIKPDAKIVEGRSASTIEAWLKKTQDAGYDLLINPELFMKDSLTPWRGMPVSEYEELISALTQIRIAEKSMREVELNGKKVALAEAVKALTGTIYEHREGKELKGFEKDNFIVEGLKLVHAAHTKIEALCKTLDGGKNLGAVWNAIYKPINDAENKRVLMRKGLEKKLEPVFGLYKPQEWGKMYKDKIAIGGLVGERMAKAEIMAIALNVGNEGNYARLMEGHDLNETKLAYLLAELDERDWHFVQGVWNAFESFKQEAFDLEQKMTGIRPVEVQAKPVVTKYGVLRGGYYPVMYDLKKLPIDSEEKIIGGNNPAATMTRHGHLKERAKHGVGTALKLDIGLIPKALNQVMTDICFREAVLDVAKVLRNKEFRTAIETTVGHEQYQSLVTWLRDVANEDKHEFAPLENFFGWARSSATIMAMGFKATTAIAQPFGITQSIQVIGLDAVRKGLKDAFGNPKLTIQKSAWIKSKSAFMADRLNAFDRDIFDSTKWSAQQALTPSSALDAITPDFIQRGEQFLKKHAFILTSLTQYGVDMPTWLGAYSKGLKDFNGDDAKAVDYADSAVRLSQGSGYTKDLARIQRGANAYKMFTMFYSYFSTVYNLTANVAADVNIKRDWQSVIKAGNAFVLLYILPSILSELAVGRGPDEDEEPLPWAVQQVLMYPMQTIVGVRTFAGVVEAEFGYKLTPAQDAPASLYNLFKELNKLAFDEDKEFDGKEFSKLAIKTYGFAKGLPLMQPVITAYNVWDYVDGTAYDFEAMDLIFTKQKSRR